MAEVRFHPEADAEYRDALAWYRSRSPESAIRFEAEAERVLTSIAAGPESFARYDDDHRFAMLSRFPNSLVFRVQLGLVLVVAVAHSRRSPSYWRGRA